MAIRPDLDMLEIVVHGVAAGQAIKNVLHYSPRSEGEEFSTTLADCLTAFRTKWRDSVLASLSDSYRVVKYTALVINGAVTNPTDPENGLLTFGDTDELAGDVSDDVGAVAGASLPTFVALTIQKRTGKAGRRKHGSVRIAPWPETATSATEQNRWTDAALGLADAMGVALTAVLDDLAFGDSLVPAVFSKTELRRSDMPKGDVEECFEVWNKYILNTDCGSQVSRKPRNSLGG